MTLVGEGGSIVTTNRERCELNRSLTAEMGLLLVIAELLVLEEPMPLVGRQWA